MTSCVICESDILLTTITCCQQVICLQCLFNLQQKSCPCCRATPVKMSIQDQQLEIPPLKDDSSPGSLIFEGWSNLTCSICLKTYFAMGMSRVIWHQNMGFRFIRYRASPEYVLKHLESTYYCCFDCSGKLIHIEFFRKKCLSEHNKIIDSYFTVFNLPPRRKKVLGNPVYAITPEISQTTTDI